MYATESIRCLPIIDNVVQSGTLEDVAFRDQPYVVL